jgi:tripartite-type tricarboxylate transporter receptor subunit TctC
MLYCGMRSILLSVLLVVAGHAAAEFPTKPIHILTGTPPGTPGDVASRIFADPLSKALGQPVIIENRPGAIGTIALAAVARAAPDGHTLGMFTMPSTIAQSLLGKMPYDTVRDFAPVRQIGWVSNLLVVRANGPFRAVPDLVAYAKAHP